MTIRRAVACGSLFLAMLGSAWLGPSAAAAQPAAPSKTAAQRALDLAYEADDLFSKGKWDEAYDRFKQADALAHSPAFTLYMARCRRNAGKLVEAQGIYERVAAEKLAPDDPKPFREAVTNATDELSELKKKIPTVRVTVSHAPKSVEVRADGKAVPADSPTAMDPGQHEITGTSGGKTVKKSVTLLEGSGETRVELDFASPDDPHPSWGRGTRAWGAISFAIASAAGAAAIATGSVAWWQRNDVASRCNGVHCSIKDTEELADAYTFANASTGLFIFGGISAVAGTVLIIVRPGPATSVALSPGSIVLRQSF